MIIILTESPYVFSTEGIKNKVTKLLGKQRGPAGVLRSLKQGLEKNNIEFKVNPRLSDIKKNDIVHVLSSFEALRAAIELKESLKISRLVAGPNITVLPTDNNGILLNKNIDIILQPSDWTKDLYVSICPELKDKIKVWPAGVEDFGIENNILNKNTVIVYKKDCPLELYNDTVKKLTERNFVVKTIEYGNFKKDEYLKLLDESKFMVYLTQSESQGLALHEAWMRNIPTLVWNQGFYRINSLDVFNTEKVSAPYLSKENGLFFNGTSDFSEKLDLFVQNLNQYTPRLDSLSKFTDSKSALAYIAQIM